MPGRHHGSPVGTGAGPEIHDPVGRPDHRRVVLDDQDAVSLSEQARGCSRSAARCRGDEGPPSVRQGSCRPPSGPSRAGRPVEPAGARRRKACRIRGPATGSRARHRPGSWSLLTISATSGEPTASNAGSIRSDSKEGRQVADGPERSARRSIGRSIRTASASGRSRDPPHAAQGTSSR